MLLFSLKNSYSINTPNFHSFSIHLKAHITNLILALLYYRQYKLYQLKSIKIEINTQADLNFKKIKTAKQVFILR